MSARYRETRGALRAAPRHWLVTGGAGFIGSALVHELVGLGQRVRVLDNLATGKRENLAPVRERIEFIEGDVASLDTCRAACGGIDHVVHLAALGSVPRSLENPLASHAANVNGFLSLLEAAREARLQRLVYASSSSVYGDAPELPKREERIGRPLSPYAATKRIDEIYAGVYQRCYGLETIGLRFFNVFGPRQDPCGPYAAVIPRWIERLFSGEPCTLYGDGSTSRDFCFVANTVQALLLAATGSSSATDRVFNVGCHAETTLLELHALLAERVGAYVPSARGASPALAAPRKGDVQHSLASLDAITQHLGYAATHDVAAGLTETVDWFAAARGAAC